MTLPTYWTYQPTKDSARLVITEAPELIGECTCLKLDPESIPGLHRINLSHIEISCRLGLENNKAYAYFIISSQNNPGVNLVYSVEQIESRQTNPERYSYSLTINCSKLNKKIIEAHKKRINDNFKFWDSF